MMELLVKNMIVSCDQNVLCCILYYIADICIIVIYSLRGEDIC